MNNELNSQNKKSKLTIMGALFCLSMGIVMVFVIANIYGPKSLVYFAGGYLMLYTGIRGLLHN